MLNITLHYICISGNEVIRVKDRVFLGNVVDALFVFTAASNFYFLDDIPTLF